MANEPGANLPPAGWFGDPGGRHQYRYWSGTSWTDHVADDGVQALDPLASQPGSLDDLRRHEAAVEAELAMVEEQLARATRSTNDADLASILIADVEERMHGGGSTGTQSPILRRGELAAELESIREQLAKLDSDTA